MSAQRSEVGGCDRLDRPPARDRHWAEADYSVIKVHKAVQRHGVIMS